MNRTIYISFLVIIFCVTNSFCQKTKVEVIFTSGDTIPGFGKFAGDYLRFKKSKKSPSRKFHLSTIESITFFDKKKGNETYRGVANNNSEIVLFMKELVKGELSLYVITEWGSFNSSWDSPSAGTGVMTSKSTNYYLRHKDKRKASLIGNKRMKVNDFYKAGFNYFANCSKLVDKIKNNEFEKRDYTSIVRFYNKNCK